MKDPHDSFSDALQQWRVRPPPDPNFRPAVWRRISRRSRETWASYVQAHLLPWSVAAAVAVAVAGWTGHAAARAKLDADRDAMVVTYLVQLDPRVQAKLRP